MSNSKARRKRLNFNKTPRQTPKSTRQSPVSPGPKVKVHLGFKGSSRQTTLKGSSKLACRAIVLKQFTLHFAGVCSSYKSTIRHVDQICQNFDQPVQNWTNRVASHYTKKLRETTHLDEHNYALSSMEDHTSCSTTLPVLETPAKRTYRQFHFNNVYFMIEYLVINTSEVFTESPYTTVMATETDEISSFQIVMDNLNMMTTARHKTEDTSNKVFNLVHALAVQDRVSADDLEDCVPQADILTIPNEIFLPSKGTTTN
ncbi:unnamed protein product [Mytilus coruscus]|uniref:Uncharacterized protein n=1 Tax=Mytilus coruscus TaxID=42192 RepID=A0A6J8D9K6_MYTCO|nr:unnamed protein product [Mytilus coruscus]